MHPPEISPSPLTYVFLLHLAVDEVDACDIEDVFEILVREISLVWVHLRTLPLAAGQTQRHRLNRQDLTWSTTQPIQLWYSQYSYATANTAMIQPIQL